MAERKFVTDKRKAKREKPLILEKVSGALGKIKNLNVLLGIISACVVIMIIASVFTGGSTIKNDVQNSDTSTYYEQVENRLSEVLSKINGAGAVSVMINYSGSSELITATTTNTSIDKTSDNGSSSNRVTESKTESVSPVIIQKNGEDTPVIVKEILPDIVGVIVVAEGAKDMSVRINLVSAVQTLLNISSDKVEIFTMKK